MTLPLRCVGINVPAVRRRNGGAPMTMIGRVAAGAHACRRRPRVSNVAINDAGGTQERMRWAHEKGKAKVDEAR